MYVKRFLEEIEICQYMNREFPFLSPQKTPTPPKGGVGVFVAGAGTFDSAKLYRSFLKKV